MALTALIIVFAMDKPQSSPAPLAAPPHYGIGWQDAAGNAYWHWEQDGWLQMPEPGVDFTVGILQSLNLSPADIPSVGVCQPYATATPEPLWLVHRKHDNQCGQRH